jgi:GTP-binding protein
MPVPQVAIVGRPNVGKSSLFNWLVGKRIAIVDSASGVTRDRVSTLVKTDGQYFELVDTGGMGVEDPDALTEQIEEQIEHAIEQADVVLFVVDARAGLVPLDEAVARRLRYVSKPVICVANKCDYPALDNQAAEFYRLGRGKLIATSTLENRNRDSLLRLIAERLPAADDEGPPPEPRMRIAIVGRRNVGKSTFINTLARGERVITSEVPGTTRDSIDVRFELDGQTFVAIDTAGVRRKKSISESIEFFSYSRAQRSIRRADVVFLFLDPTERIGKVDKQLADYVFSQYKPCIFVVNKWDLMHPAPTNRWVAYLRDSFPGMAYAPIAFITGQTGKNVRALLNLGQSLFKQASARVSTGELNRVVRAALERNPPPVRENRRPKIYYATQVGERPPTIVLFANRPSLFDATYRRYLLGVFRDNLPFREVPIKLYLRQREPSDQGVPEAVEETS